MPRPPFDSELLKKRGLFHKLIGREPSINARIELKNKLSTVALYSEVGPDFFTDIEARYKFDVRSKYAGDLADWYWSAAHCYLGKATVTEDDALALVSLAELLKMPEETAKSIRLAETGPAFSALIALAAAKGRASPEAQAGLDALIARFDISAPEASAIYNKIGRQVLDSEDKPLGDKAVVSPEDEKPVIALATNLGKRA